MLLAITESNAWERERWTYVIDIELQDSEALNHLMIFIKFANDHFEQLKESAGERLFAASKYWVKFYSRLDTTRGYTCLVASSGSTLIMNGDKGYKGDCFDLRKMISPRRMKAAMQRMRDKGGNDLYKNMDHIFLRSKISKREAAKVEATG